MKTCKKCGQTLLGGNFYSVPGNRDGLSGSCKKCTLAAVAKYRAENIEKIRAYNRARGNRLTPEAIRRYRDKNPIKRAAQVALCNAVRDKRVVKISSCQACGSSRNIVGHHPDYSRPFDVVWLCQACHCQHHARFGEGKNAHTHKEAA